MNSKLPNLKKFHMRHKSTLLVWCFVGLQVSKFQVQIWVVGIKETQTSGSCFSGLLAFEVPQMPAK